MYTRVFRNYDRVVETEWITMKNRKLKMICLVSNERTKTFLFKSTLIRVIIICDKNKMYKYFLILYPS